MERRQTLLPWTVWLISSLFVGFQFLLQSSTSVMIPELVHDLHVDIEAIGFISASFFYTYLVLQIPAGILVDRFGARNTMLVGLFLMCFACMWFANANTFREAEVGRMMMGISAAPAFSAAMWLLARWFPIERFALMVGLTEFIAMSGGIVGEVNVAESVAWVGWRETFWFATGIAFVLLLLTWFFVRNRPSSALHVLPPAQSPMEKIRTLIRLLTRPQLWLNGLFSGFIAAIVAGFAGLWAVPFLKTAYGISTELAAAGSAMIFLGVAIGGPCFGWYSDHIGKRKPAMLVGGASCLLVMLLILYIPNIPLAAMFALLLLLGFTSTAYMIPFAIARDRTPEESHGAAISFTNMLSIGIGAPILQPLIGILLKHNASAHAGQFTTADYQSALVVFPIVLSIALVLLPWIKETHCSPVNIDPRNAE